MLKGMAWNVFAPANNTLWSFMSNLTHASGEEDFTVSELFSAKSLMLHSIGKSLTLDTVESKMAKKINSGIEKFAVVGDYHQVGYSESGSTSTISKGLSKLGPMEGTKRVEYLNRGTTFVALLKGTNLEGKKRKDGEPSLFEAFDENFNWKKEYGEEPTQMLIDFKVKLDQLLKSIHGNYDFDSVVKIKETVWGQVVMLFRGWVAEGFANRFEDEKPDSLLGRTRKGRYRTWNPLSGGSVGRLSGAKLLLQQMMRILTFNSTFKGSLDKLSEVDRANMKKNAMEAILWIALYTMIMMLRVAIDDEDDEDVKFGMMSAINLGFRLQNEMAFFTSPEAFEKITQSSIPPMQIVTDAYKLIDAMEKSIAGD